MVNAVLTQCLVRCTSMVPENGQFIMSNSLWGFPPLVASEVMYGIIDQFGALVVCP